MTAIYGHRGASLDLPEMSFVAYFEAVEQGADGFECDIRLSKDGYLMLWHDEDMQRMANSPLKIAHSTLREIQQVFPAMIFEELLAIAIDEKKNLALETKHPVPTGGAVEKKLFEVLSANAEQIAAAGIDIVIMSFSWRAVMRAKRAGFSAIYLIVHKWQRFFCFVDGVGPSIQLLKRDKNFAKKVKASGKKLFVWTANTEDDAKALIGSGADVVMSDAPGALREFLEK